MKFFVGVAFALLGLSSAAQAAGKSSSIDTDNKVRGKAAQVQTVVAPPAPLTSARKK